MPRTDVISGPERQADRLLRDRRSSSSSSSSCRRRGPGQRHRADHGVELRVHDRPASGRVRAARCNYPAIHHRGAPRIARCASSGSTAWSTRRATTCRTSSPWTRPCTGPNPAGGPGGTDTHGMDGTPYTGPVPIVTHVHGAHTTRGQRRLPGGLVPAGREQHPGRLRHATAPTTSSSSRRPRRVRARPGRTAQRPSSTPTTSGRRPCGTTTTALGMTRLNVYAGPAGFYLIRGKTRQGGQGSLPRPAPQRGDKPGTKYHEIPIAIQDRSVQRRRLAVLPGQPRLLRGAEQAGQDAAVPRRAGAAASRSSPTWP